ncbi:MAG: nucleotidyltransferase domain-containing protein [bacterium]|nr:nucleotidyltransferase domain-containing protein [bacterium]
MTKIEMEQKLKEITEKIVKEYDPEKIILFGSYAWGTPGPDSDVDLLIVKESNDRRIERERCVQRILFRSKMPIDVLVYSQQELEEKINKDRNLFLEDIVRNGRVLYTKTRVEITLSHRPAELVL